LCLNHATVKFGPKEPTPNREDARFTFHTRRAVQSAIADLLVSVGQNRLSLNMSFQSGRVGVR